MVYILLGNGFEEAEALVTADVLRRAGLEVSLTGIGGREIAGAHGITVVADTQVEQVIPTAGDMILLPGGMGGVDSIEGSAAAMALARQAAEDDALWLAAICAAPAMLSRRGIIGQGRRAVCYPGLEEQLLHAGVIPCMDVPAVWDGRLITGKGPGTAYEFALLIVRALVGADAAVRLRAELRCDG